MPILPRAGWLALLLWLAPSGCQPTPAAPVPPATEIPNTLQTLADDMTLPHQGRLHGVPEAYDWSRGPRMGAGNDPGGFRAITAWGQLYEAAEGNPAANTRVHLKDIRTYILSRKDGRWRAVQERAAVEGGAFAEDFAANRSKAADVRPEPEGGVSVTAGGGYNFHFWPPGGRGAIDPADVAGVFTTVRARLILADPAGPDDRAGARYLLGMGADYWRDASAQWPDNKDVAIGRHRYVQSAWMSFNMTTLGADELGRTPPPGLGP